MRGIIQCILLFSYHVMSVYGEGSISVGGYGVHLPNIVSDKQFSLRTTGKIVASLFGISYNNDNYLPVGDILSRPRASVIVAVDGVHPNDFVGGSNFVSKILSEGPTYRLTSDIDNLSFDEKLNDMLKFGNGNLDTTLRNEFKFSRVFQTFSSQPKANMGLDEFLKKEFEEISSLNLDSDENESPDVILLSCRAMSYFDKTHSNLDKLSESINAALQAINTTYGGRAAYEIVLLGNSVEAHTDRRMLADSDSANVANTTQVFDTTQYLLMVWSSIFLALTLLCLFCCVQWADELDPLLYAGLGKDETKKD